jgi:cytochrome P450
MLPPDFKEDPTQDPYPHYARLREAGPVVQINSASGLRPYLITRYEDAKAALSDPRFAKDPHHGADLINGTGLGEYFLAQESRRTCWRRIRQITCVCAKRFPIISMADK